MSLTKPSESAESIQEKIREYYGETLKSSRDLKTNACCTNDDIPLAHRKILSELNDEILDKFYGCGSPIPESIEGLKILDLGCGTGRDTYLLSRLVGSHGNVIGIDMTLEQLDVARRHLPEQMQRWGYAQPNVEFLHGTIENLQILGIPSNSLDIVISNCVINLSTDKESVFREIFRVLKPGGELYFSDIFAGRRIPLSLQNDPILSGECLGGALYHEDFRRILRSIGVLDFRTVSNRKLEIDNAELEARIGMVDFYSKTIRAFKLTDLEDVCEDFGQTATYLGTVKNVPHEFILDDHHNFKTGKPMLVCGNTAAMLGETRFRNHFKITGDRSTHFGIFPCGPDTFTSNLGNSNSGACC